MSESHSRLQSIFQNFYGLGLSDGHTQVTIDPYNVDSPHYSVLDHFEKEVKRSDLQTLKKHTQDYDTGFTFSFLNSFLSVSSFSSNITIHNLRNSPIRWKTPKSCL